jgi:hypothetical protein
LELCEEYVPVQRNLHGQYLIRKVEVIGVMECVEK